MKEYVTVSHKFNDLWERLSMPQFKRHSLRHSFATKIVAKGEDIYTVKGLLSHQDIRTSMVYAKVSTDKLRDAVDKLWRRWVVEISNEDYDLL